MTVTINHTISLDETLTSYLEDAGVSSIPSDVDEIVVTVEADENDFRVTDVDVDFIHASDVEEFISTIAYDDVTDEIRYAMEERADHDPYGF